MPSESRAIEKMLPTILSSGFTTELEVFLMWLSTIVDSFAVLFDRWYS